MLWGAGPKLYKLRRGASFPPPGSTTEEKNLAPGLWGGKRDKWILPTKQTEPEIKSVVHAISLPSRLESRFDGQLWLPIHARENLERRRATVHMHDDPLVLPLLVGT